MHFFTQKNRWNIQRIDRQGLFLPIPDMAESILFMNTESGKPDFSREELIKTIYIPKNKFAPLFKQYAGMSFSKYINNLRLEYAAKMLKNHPDYTVDTIAQECGMSTQSLYRLFSGKFGVTPTDFQVGVQHINNKNITEDK